MYFYYLNRRRKLRINEKRRGSLNGGEWIFAHYQIIDRQLESDTKECLTWLYIGGSPIYSTENNPFLKVEIYKEWIITNGIPPENELLRTVYWCQSIWILRFWAKWRLFTIRRRIARRIISNFNYNYVIPRIYSPHLKGCMFLKMFHSNLLTQ